MKTCVVHLVTCSLLLAVALSDSEEQKGNTENQETRSTKGLAGPELVSQMTVGTRVIRGKDWDWGDQDGGPGGLGTVVHAIKDGWLQIEWDSGIANSYRMGSDNKYDLDLAGSSTVILTTTHKSVPANLKETDEISDPESGEIFRIGSRVVRGRDWEWDDQDGGEGNVGEIIAIDNRNKWVTVKWDLLEKEQYRMGHKGKYDLKLSLEDTEIITKRKSTPSEDAEIDEIYNQEQENPFKVGSRVVRGRDWDWDDEDGGDGNEGKIIAINIKNLTATVEWDLGGQNGYRIGYKGYNDIQLAPEPNKKAHTISMVSSTRSATTKPTRISASKAGVTSLISTPRPKVTSSISTRIAEVTPTTRPEVKSLKSIETATDRSTSVTTNDDVQELNKIFGLLLSKEILRVPPNFRLQVYQEILKVFKKYTA